jgi:hypothetical protein
MNEAAMSKRGLAALAALVLALPCCGGGGGGGPNGPTGTGGGTTTTTTTTTTTLPPAGAEPTLRISENTRAGKSPLSVRFDLCGSRDGNGGTSLTYLADFEGRGFNVQGSCAFSHTYTSNGVSVDNTQLCVRDSADRSVCDTRRIKSYVDVDVRADPTTGCAGTIIATARLASGNFNGVRAMAEVDRVEFEAFNGAGQRVAPPRNGQKQNATQWTTGTWNVNDTTKLRVLATIFAGTVRGDDTPEDTRPACGS